MHRYRTILFVFLSIVACLLYSEGQSDSGVVQRDYAFSDFSSLSVDGSFRIRIIQSEEWGIHLACAREDFAGIKMRKHSDIFEVSMAPERNLALPSPVLVISMPQLNGVTLNGTVQMEAGGFSSESDFKAVLNPGSFLKLSGFECFKADFHITGPTELHTFLSAVYINIYSEGKTSVTMGGRAENLMIDSRGRSKIDGSLLLVDHVDLQLEGMGEVRITPDVTMQINSSDNALIYYSDQYMDNPPVNIGNAILRKY